MFKGLLSLVLVIGALLPSADSKELQASDTLDRCIETMGGLQRLQSARIGTYQAVGYTFLRSISTVDSEPGVHSYESKEVILDLQRQLIHEQIRSQWTKSETPNTLEALLSPEGGYVERNGKRTPASADRHYEAVDTLLGPDTIEFSCCLSAGGRVEELQESRNPRTVGRKYRQRSQNNGRNLRLGSADGI